MRNKYSVAPITHWCNSRRTDSYCIADTIVKGLTKAGYAHKLVLENKGEEGI